MPKRSAIALLVTLFFIVAISVLMGIGLKYVNAIATKSAHEAFVLQTRVVLDDILTILKSSKEIASVADSNASEDFYTFLAQSNTIPLNSQNMEVLLEISSARQNLNINLFRETNATLSTKRSEALRSYFGSLNVEASYADYLLDAMGGVRSDGVYRSDLFTYKPELFRDYIASREHLLQINRVFGNRFVTRSYENIPFDTLFLFHKDAKTEVDLNFASVDLWMLLLGCDKARAETIFSAAGVCNDMECFELTPQERERLALFGITKQKTQKVLAIKVTIRNEKFSAKVGFEYNMASKKGSNFVYEI